MQWEKMTHEEFIKDLESFMPSEVFEKLRTVFDTNIEQRRVYKDGKLVEVNGMSIEEATV